MIYDIKIAENQYVSANPDKAVEYLHQGYKVLLDGQEVTESEIVENIENHSVEVVISGN